MKSIERIGRVGAAVALGIALNFGIDQKGEGYLENAPNCPNGISPRGDCLPTHTPTPNIQATIEAQVRATLTAIPQSNPANPNNPIIVMPPQANPGPETKVVIVSPEIVKPEVVKPEIVRVPEIIRIEVPVTATPDPSIICLRQQELNDLIRYRASSFTEATVTALERKEPTPVYIPIPTTVKDEERADWGAWWTYFIVGGLGVVLGAVANRYRNRITIT